MRRHNKLDGKDLTLLRTILDSPGIKTEDLAKVVGLRRPTASLRINRPVFKLELERRQLGALERLTKAQGRAVDRLLELLEQKRDPAIALRAALFILAPLRTQDPQTNAAENYAVFLEESMRRWRARLTEEHALQNGSSDLDKDREPPNKTEQDRTKAANSAVVPVRSARRRPPPPRKAVAETD